MPTHFTAMHLGKMEQGEIYTLDNGIILGVLKVKNNNATTWQLSKWQVPFWEFGWGTIHIVKSIIGKFKHA